MTGTHQHSKFVTPDEMRAWLPGDMRVVGTQGLEYNVLLGKWSATSDLSVNYMMCAKRDALRPSVSQSVSE